MESQVSGIIAQIKTENTTHNIAASAYGICDTSASTPAKTVDMTGFKLNTGVVGITITVKFIYSNTASNPTLNVATTGAKPIILYNGNAPGNTPETSWYEGSTVIFTYDGTNWVLNNGIGQDTKILIEDWTTQGGI